MWRYILNRILWLIVIALCVAIVIFTIMYFIPGDPAVLILGADTDEAELAAYRAYLGIDQPYAKQLSTFLSNVFLHFDFGISWYYQVPVTTELAIRLPRTLALGWIWIILHSLIGIPIGIACALHRNSPLDHGLMVGAVFGVSVPDFWLALMLVVVFSLNLGWLPARGIGGIEYWILPILSGAFSGIALNARQTRSAVLETIRADFVTTARAKGVPERKVIFKHMLPNALIPIVASMGTAFASSIAGAVVIETVFSFPGVGTYLMTGISQRDYPIVRSCVLILTIFSAVIILLVDIVYAFIDPRIKAQYVQQASRKARKPI